MTDTVSLNECLVEGISLRDYIAIHAPLSTLDAAKMMEEVGKEKATYVEIYAWLAKMRYIYADAMLEARNGQ